MNRAVYELKEGYELMCSESRKFLRLFRDEGEAIKKKYPHAKVYPVHNDHFNAGCNIELNGFTISAYYGIPIVKSSKASFLSIHIFDMTFNNKGQPMPHLTNIDEHRLLHSTFNLHSFGGHLRWMELSEKCTNYSSEQLLIKWGLEFLKLAANHDLNDSVDKAA